MRARIILLLSVGLNAALLVALLTRPDKDLPQFSSSGARAAHLTRPSGIKTNVVVRRTTFVWSDIESSDYKQFIANLRSIGCPENTIRDIIVADVNQLYEKKRVTEIMTNGQQWWKSEPDPQVLHAAIDKQLQIDSERRALLTELLGTGWQKETAPPIPSTTVTVLDGPILAGLSADTRRSLQEIEGRAEKRREALVAAQKNGEQVSPAEIARMRQETRDDLAKVLSPQQLEEYLLRYSQNASNLREELKGFSASADEFRAIFRARDSIDQQISLYYGAEDPASMKRRKELETVREEAIKQAIGPDRYTLYKYTQDPVFQQAQASAEQIGAPPEKVLPLFQINQATQRELERIQADTSMTVEQQRAALRAVQEGQANSIRKVLGEEAYENYAKAASEPPRPPVQ